MQKNLFCKLRFLCTTYPNGDIENLEIAVGGYLQIRTALGFGPFFFCIGRARIVCRSAWSASANSFSERNEKIREKKQPCQEISAGKYVEKEETVFFMLSIFEK